MEMRFGFAPSLSNLLELLNKSPIPQSERSCCETTKGRTYEHIARQAFAWGQFQQEDPRSIGGSVQRFSPHASHFSAGY